MLLLITVITVLPSISGWGKGRGGGVAKNILVDQGFSCENREPLCDDGRKLRTRIFNN